MPVSPMPDKLSAPVNIGTPFQRRQLATAPARFLGLRADRGGRRRERIPRRVEHVDECAPGPYGEQSVSAFGPHCRFRRSGQPPRPEFSTGAKSANWPLWTIVAQLPHLWQIFVASILTALAMVNHNCDGFGPYQYCLDARTVFAIPVAPSDVSERNAIVEAEDWGHP
jgi:hypothetical protein